KGAKRLSYRHSTDDVRYRTCRFWLLGAGGQAPLILILAWNFAQVGSRIGDIKPPWGLGGEEKRGSRFICVLKFVKNVYQIGIFYYLCSRISNTRNNGSSKYQRI
ncbi:hypothetical protein NNC77_16155, partial [Prevotella copri]|uniref:hypothetical protein n=1 Tax=Segatella copri TaxID=165179 RepID=UPI0020CEE1B9